MKWVRLIHLPWSAQDPAAFNIIGSPIGACRYKLSQRSLNFKTVVSLTDLFTTCMFQWSPLVRQLLRFFASPSQFPYMLELFLHTLQDVIMNNDSGSETDYPSPFKIFFLFIYFSQNFGFWASLFPQCLVFPLSGLRRFVERSVIFLYKTSLLLNSLYIRSMYAVIFL